MLIVGSRNEGGQFTLHGSDGKDLETSYNLDVLFISV